MKNKSVTIKGAKWKVLFVSDASEFLEGNDGITCKKTKTIYISKNPSHNVENVYWHEYFHAFLFECGIRDLDDHFEHVIVENLADLMEGVSK
jgi:hypothetical protein